MKKTLLLLALITLAPISLTPVMAEELPENNRFCSFYPSGGIGVPTGNVTIRNDCVIYEAMNGASAGNLTIDNATVSLHKTLTFDPDKELVIQNGAVIWINTNGTIKEGKLCAADADNDLYPEMTTTSIDPNTGKEIEGTYTNQVIDYKLADPITNTCEPGYTLKESLASVSFVDTDVDTDIFGKSSLRTMGTADSELLRLGFTIDNVSDALAAVGDVQLIDRNLLICTAGSCPTTNFTADSGSLYVAGNVGIGIANPDTRLVVNQRIAGNTVLKISNNSVLPNRGAALELSPNNISQAYSRISQNISDSFQMLFENLANSNNVGFIFKTNYGGAKERMRITGSGNVGIGTSAPSATLHVNGYASYTTGTTSAGATGNASWATGKASQAVNTSILASNMVVSAGYFSVSDQRLKENVFDISPSQAQDFISKVDPVSFNWKDSGNYDTGFIAQDLIRQGFGHLVSAVPNDNLKETKDSDGLVSPQGFQYIVNYDAIVPLLTAGLKETNQDLNSLTQENEDLKKQLNDIKQRLNQIENSLRQNSCY